MKNKTALLILDMFNTLDFPEGKALAKRALPIAKNIHRLKEKCRKQKIPIIYVNDNFGQWDSDWKKIFSLCASPKSRGKKLAEILKPHEKDLFVLKRKHSGFYSTNLEPLLKDLKIRRLILTGIAGDICVLFTAHDAHMRDYDLIIPKDCMASNTARADRELLHQLEKTLKFNTTESKRISLVES